VGVKLRLARTDPDLKLKRRVVQIRRKVLRGADGDGPGAGNRCLLARAVHGCDARRRQDPQAVTANWRPRGGDPLTHGEIGNDAVEDLALAPGACPSGTCPRFSSQAAAMGPPWRTALLHDSAGLQRPLSRPSARARKSAASFSRIIFRARCGSGRAGCCMRCALQPVFDHDDVALQFPLHLEQQVAVLPPRLHPAAEHGADDLRPASALPQARAVEAHALADGSRSLRELHPEAGPHTDRAAGQLLDALQPDVPPRLVGRVAA
jgi:hypothetical protein